MKSCVSAQEGQLTPRVGRLRAGLPSEASRPYSSRGASVARPARGTQRRRPRVRGPMPAPTGARRRALPALLDGGARFPVGQLPAHLRRIRFCRSRSPATARRTSSSRGAPSGTRRATALSWRVMTTSSPLETRSSSSPKRVLASKAVTLLMPQFGPVIDQPERPELQRISAALRRVASAVEARRPDARLRTSRPARPLPYYHPAGGRLWSSSSPSGRSLTTAVAGRSPTSSIGEAYDMPSR